MSLVVVTLEETVFRNYGYADREQETAADSSTLFELGSMSKAFTALGILLLEQEGKLGWTTISGNTFPGWPCSSMEIIRDKNRR